jgi:hypothetical protein
LRTYRPSRRRWVSSTAKMDTQCSNTRNLEFEEAAHLRDEIVDRTSVCWPADQPTRPFNTVRGPSAVEFSRRRAQQILRGVDRAGRLKPGRRSLLGDQVVCQLGEERGRSQLRLTDLTSSPHSSLGAPMVHTSSTADVSRVRCRLPAGRCSATRNNQFRRTPRRTNVRVSTHVAGGYSPR